MTKYDIFKQKILENKKIEFDHEFDGTADDLINHLDKLNNSCEFIYFYKLPSLNSILKHD